MGTKKLGNCLLLTRMHRKSYPKSMVVYRLRVNVASVSLRSSVPFTVDKDEAQVAPNKDADLDRVVALVRWTMNIF